ncbi:hypothetical protein KsCSTR_32280 [Candidatus Kuenenia stuttgartiensis]|uniref:Uncharacterized protein n=1 Tax=Kuenenia stuttgartiensis TaxID=174633 RepID=Q1Q4R5_KUEST|nr:hypothetical protein KsCSTR_32280 [Candidatus Kuenenia stuttgartiensis]CAJ74999.1 unknown protein [Candidatus Kuenenia stuttgartiensis]
MLIAIELLIVYCTYSLLQNVEFYHYFFLYISKLKLYCYFPIDFQYMRNFTVWNKRKKWEV